MPVILARRLRKTYGDTVALDGIEQGIATLAICASRKGASWVARLVGFHVALDDDPPRSDRGLAAAALLLFAAARVRRRQAPL